MSTSTVTAEDVARHAGVSRSTVSRAYSPERPVNPKTRAKILTAARELGYEPNALAQALISRRSQIVGILMADLHNPEHAVIHQTISLKLQAHGYIPLSAQMGPDIGIDAVISMFRKYLVSVVILTSMRVDQAMIAACRDAGLQVLLLNRLDDDSTVASVCCDLMQGGILGAQHLIQKGYRRIGVAEGTAGNWTSRTRIAGHLAGLERADLVPAFVIDGGYTYAEGARAADRVAQSGWPDAMLCPNDLFAIGFMDRARKAHGLTLPDDLAMIGFDDIPMADWSSYDLTTVRLPIESMTDLSLGVIDRMVQKDVPPSEKILVPCRLIRRGSA